MKAKRGSSKVWALLYRFGLAKAHMPFWRVVVEAKLNRRTRKWPRRYDGAVTGVFVWARTIEEAEGLAALALEEEGLEALTADAVKCPPAAPPSKVPVATARTELGLLAREDDSVSHPDARA